MFAVGVLRRPHHPGCSVATQPERAPAGAPGFGYTGCFLSFTISNR